MTALLLMMLTMRAQVSPDAAVDKDFPLRYRIPLAQLAILEVAPEKSTYEVAEPVRLRFTVRNTSRQEFWCFCVQAYMAKVSYRRQGEAFSTLKLRTWLPHNFPMYRLKPGEAVTEVVTATYDLAKDAPPFDAPGRYELEAVYFDRGGVEASRLVSKRVSVTVVGPNDTVAYAAYTRNLAKLAQIGALSGMLPEGVDDEAAQFLERYGMSIYAGPVRGGLMAILKDRMIGGTATDQDRALYEALLRAQAAESRQE